MIYYLLTLSAILYASAYWHPSILWWGACASMFPLFVMQGTVYQYMWYGIFWGVIAYSLHLWGVLVGIISLASYNTWHVWCISIVLVIYMALCTGIIWSFGAWCEKKIIKSRRMIFLHYAWWSNWLALYWYLFTYCIFFLLGNCEGYLFLNPIIPFAVYPILLKPVSYTGVAGYATLYCYAMGIITYIYRHGSCKKKIMLSGIILLICFYTVYCIKNSSVFNSNNVPIVGIPKWIGHTDKLEPACRLLSHYISMAGQGKQVVGVAFPESSLYPWRICADSRLKNFITYDGTPTVHDCIIGSFYDDNGKYRNSCYWLRDGVVQKRFDKRHAMPLIERIPLLFKYCSWIRPLFFSVMPEIVPSHNERPCMMMGNIPVVPYICSELFFNKNPDDTYRDLPILALVNDRWCPYEYVKHLMYLGAVVQAYVWNRTIVYVSYSRFLYIVPPSLMGYDFFC